MEATTVNRLLEQITRWGEHREDVSGLMLVGSWARGSARADSDVDLMFLVDEPDGLQQDTGWMGEIELGLAISDWRDEEYGAAWSRHVYLEDGSKLEFGFSTSNWAKTDPVDAGTFRVVSDGCRILYDPEGLLEHLLHPVGSR